MKKLHILAPWFFAIYYVLFFYSINAAEATFGSILLPPLAFLVFLVTLIWLLLKLVLRDSTNASLLSTIAAFIVVSHGHIHEILYDVMLFGVRLGRLRFLFPVWGLLFSAAVYAVSRIPLNSTKILKSINLVVAILTVISIFTILQKDAMVSMKTNDLQTTPSDSLVSSKPPLGYYPDIYYIILDGYGSNSVFKALFSFDNRTFLEELRKRGFYISDSARSNHAQTFESLPSALNMQYVHEILPKDFDKARGESRNLTMNAKIFQILEHFGYNYIGLGSRAGRKLVDRLLFSEFSRVFISTTLLYPVMKNLLSRFDNRPPAIRSQFEYLTDEVWKLSVPKVVFSHLLIPHPPFLFDADGNRIDQGTDNMFLYQNKWLPRQAYINQVMFANRYMLEAVDSILIHSENPPVIIIQGDHGPASLLGGFDSGRWENPSDEMVFERMGILNAYYMPGDLDSLLYPQITPVNSFRVVLNGCLGFDEPYLEDRLIFSSSRDTIHEDVTDRVLRLQRKVAESDSLFTLENVRTKTAK